MECLCSTMSTAAKGNSKKTVAAPTRGPGGEAVDTVVMKKVVTKKMRVI